MAVLLLDLLPGLPEEQIGADRGAEDRDERRSHRRRSTAISGTTSGGQRLAPRHMRDRHHGDIGEQRQASSI